MTLDEQNANSLGCYHDAVSALRLRAVVSGDVLPREREPIDLVLLAALSAPAREARTANRNQEQPSRRPVQPPSTYNTTKHKGG